MFVVEIENKGEYKNKEIWLGTKNKSMKRYINEPTFCHQHQHQRMSMRQRLSPSSDEVLGAFFLFRLDRLEAAALKKN